MECLQRGAETTAASGQERKFSDLGRMKLLWRSALVLVIMPAVFAGSAGATDYRGCAVIDADVLLKETRIGSRALADIEAKFRPREKAIIPLARARNSAEKVWLDALESELPMPRIDEARRVFDKAQAEEAVLLKALRSDVSWLRVQESTRILDKASSVYAELGRRLRYAKLYQKGYGQPIIEPEAQARSFECQSKDDITAKLVREIDKIFP